VWGRCGAGRGSRWGEIGRNKQGSVCGVSYLSGNVCVVVVWAIFNVSWAKVTTPT